MQKEIFDKLKGIECKIALRPNAFILYGWIDAVFDDSIEFRTDEKTSYIDFTTIMNITPVEGNNDHK